MDIVTVIKVLGTVLTVVATSIEATNKKQYEIKYHHN